MWRLVREGAERDGTGVGFVEARDDSAAVRLGEVSVGASMRQVEVSGRGSWFRPSVSGRCGWQRRSPLFVSRRRKKRCASASAPVDDVASGGLASGHEESGVGATALGLVSAALMLAGAVLAISDLM